MQEIEQFSQTIEEQVADTVAALRRGLVILYPTDTIWGLGCDLTNNSAVKRIYEIKKRPQNKPFVLLVNDVEMLKRYVDRIHPRIETLLAHHVQPLTIIYDGAKNLPDICIAEEGTVAIRVVKHPFCEAVIKAIDQPLISTSANFAGNEFPSEFSEIDPQIIEMADMVVDPSLNESMSTKQPSVIASYSGKGELNIIRS